MTDIYARQTAAYQRVAAWLDGEEARGYVGQLVGAFTRCFRAGGRVYLLGNGGSAADAQHVAAEYVGRFRKGLHRDALPVIALTTDTSVLTAVGNDFGFERIFERQLAALARDEDVVVFHSTSGVSPNLVCAARWLKDNVGAVTFALLGHPEQCGHSELARSVGFPLCVPTAEGPAVQLGHMMLQHLVADAIDYHAKSNGGTP